MMWGYEEYFYVFASLSSFLACIINTVHVVVQVFMDEEKKEKKSYINLFLRISRHQNICI